VPSDYKEWGRREFARDEFRLVADCAYFEYQRNRIYVRTNTKVRRYQRRVKKRSETVATRPNKIVDHTVRVCPRCKSDDLVFDYQEGKEKYAYDLRVSRGGIRGWITKTRIPRHECASCKHAFVPGGPRSSQRLGHNLLAWAMHQHVSNRITLANLAMTARECFGLDLGKWEFQRLKSMAGAYYRDTYDSLLRELVTGPLLHIDETSIWLRGHVTGYVWVFASMESVVFMYRSTREGEFLHDLLRSFKGVMVTDFYTAYDSIQCPQQKCLVHLMWDINRAILKHPFDKELNDIGRTFGALMRDIVGTIDRYGLKSRYLRRHGEQASTWRRELRGSPGKSIIAEKFRKRIVKYGDRLFTFLDHDGVPWNNNNAENSIKPFAKYRRLVRGRITEPGLRDYLVLLSIAHTCKYRGVSLLEFLLSGAQQIPD
jgi:Transposase IS66 family